MEHERSLDHLGWESSSLQFLLYFTKMFFELDDMSIGDSSLSGNYSSGALVSQQTKVSMNDLDEGLPQKPGLVPDCGPLMVVMNLANRLDFFEPIDEAIVSFGETVLGFFGFNRNIANMNRDVPPIKFWIELEGVYVIYVVVIDVERVLTILLDNISDYPASFSALMLPFLDVVAEVANHVLVNERKLEFRYVSADGFELEYKMLEIADVMVVKLTTISFSK
ncbi:uncharacterized protein LAESUDRAFT_761470 [Laetiporus sulphureus 93-53]|uniref:Uncharacterized protein n=1 Tax=Laetiporus sulphureus 93-53 TaxID=1314785 RepID=A0A165D432_9APHY|nr:uncharacterized protein LAESUDRAFT_761470 [Laetiporus sulphureus 93-53]KZT04115.1 hypothetical protein LAESUDRAFT_761470 [Laetiporus sulphureus 93-53]